MVNEIRDGKRVVPTCIECGCRLDIKAEGFLQHFLSKDHTTDARGCKCKHLNKSWMKTQNGWTYYITFTSVVGY
jgi:hypothetical protein